MVLNYLLTRMHKEGSSNPFLSAICRIAKAHGGNQAQERHIQGAMALLEAITSHLGAAAVLSRFQGSTSLKVDSTLMSATVTNRAAISIAVALGNLSKVTKLLDEGADPNYASEFGLPLSIAVHTSQFQMAEILLGRGANINNGLGFIPRQGTGPRLALHGAALAGNEQVLKLILNPRQNSVSSGIDYERAIYYAARGGHEEMVWFLINRCTYFSGLLRVKSLTLLEGAKAGQAGIVRMLLKHGVDANFTYEAGRCALHWSSFRGHLQITRMLLEYGANADVCDQHYKSTPLVLASVNGHVDVMKLLLQSGCAVNTKIWNECLRQAVREGHLGTVRYCLESGADLFAEEFGVIPRNLGNGLLFLACRESHVDVVRCLVKEYGINPDGIGDPAQNVGSPMLTALSKGNERLVQALLNLGASSVDLEKSCIRHNFPLGTAQWQQMGQAGYQPCPFFPLPRAPSGGPLRMFWLDYFSSCSRPNFFVPSNPF